jgi:lysophospholipase L1-like esterase
VRINGGGAMKRSILIISVTCFLEFLNWGRTCSQTSADVLYKQNRNYTVQTELYDIYKTEKADVVMLGNSITFGVNWNELMGRTKIVNRGIGSDNTSGILQRMEYIYKLHPQLCCIMGGINDIYQDAPVEKIYENYKKIIEGLQAHKIVPIIQSTLFVSTKWKRFAEKNLAVEKLDSMLADLARLKGIEFVNLNAVMSKDHLLLEELTTDGVHLTAKGYALWRDELEKILKKHGI